MKQFSILILVLVSTSIFAQKANYNIDKAVDDITKLYKLSDSQKTQYKDIVQTKFDSFAQVMKDTKDGKPNQASMDEASKKYDESFLAILTEDQKQIFYIQKRMAIGAKADRKAQSMKDIKQANQIQPAKQ